MLTTVLTHGPLHGALVREDPKTAKAIAAEIAGDGRNFRSASAASLAAEELRRSRQRGKGDNSSKVTRINRALRALGCPLTLDELAARADLAKMAR